MKKILNFENLADKFSKELNSGLSGTSTVSRCDKVIIDGEKVLFLEFTKVSAKKLYLPNRFSNEVVENVKKMWGSLATFSWYLCENEKDSVEGKERFFILVLEEKLDSKHLRLIGNLLKAIRKFRNGGFSEIKYKEF